MRSSSFVGVEAGEKRLGGEKGRVDTFMTETAFLVLCALDHCVLKTVILM